MIEFLKTRPFLWRTIVSTHGVFTAPDFRRNPVAAVFGRGIFNLRAVMVRFGILGDPWLVPYIRDTKLYIPTKANYRQIYYHGFYEHPNDLLLERLLEKGGTFIDVGANVGAYTVLASKLVGDKGRVISFEPGPVNDILRANIEINGLGNVEVEGLALSNTDGEVSFALNDVPLLSQIISGDSVDVRDGTSTIMQVKSSTLDSLFPHDLGSNLVIKVDVEGQEPAVIYGAKNMNEWNGSSAPIWLFEYSTEWTRLGYDIKNVRSFLKRSGYELYSFMPNRGMVVVPVGEEASMAKFLVRNLVALKQEHLDRINPI